MYQKEEVERLAGEYVETGDERVFEALIKALIPLIDVQLGKNYSSLKEFWDDLRQEVLLRVYRNRGGLRTTKSTVLYQYFYNRIRDYLFQAVGILQGKRKKKKIKMGYDMLNSDIISLDALSVKEKQKLGIDLTEEDYD
jgi:DNA-directed RNA polymerase specialized sigma24 family protein